MMKRLGFLETKRTPRYSLRKLNVGMASVLLGVTIFGINLTNHSVKAATTDSPKQTLVPTDANTHKVTSTTEKVQQNSGSKNATANNSTESATTLQSSPKTQGSASKNATANNPTESATTSQSLPKTQGSAHTYIRSLAAKSAEKLAFMNLMAASGTPTGTGTGTPTGTDRNAAATVDKNNVNDQSAKENQKLANDHNLTSSDNYSSNIYKGTDGKYYKIVTIYGNDYVYRAADIQANGTAGGQWATTAADTKNNIHISKEDLGNGQTRWKVVFFPNRGLENDGGTLHGLSSAKFGIALTSDYQIVGNVDMKVNSDANQTFESYTFEPGSTRATEFPIQNLQYEKDFSFNPKTDVDPNTGLINSETMPAYNNHYLQPSYYFTTATDVGAKNLWQTYFFNNGNETYDNNAYDNSPYLGGNHDFHLNNFIIKNETGDVDGAEKGDKIIYDRLGYRLNSKNGVANSNGVYSSDNFNQAMEFKSQGVTSNSQFSSYVISFITQHTDSHEVQLNTGWKNQQFSGISANIYSYQNKYYNMFSRLYGEQRALNAAGVAKTPKDVISGWGDATRAMDQMEKDYLNNAQINVLRNKILNNITDPDAVNNIIKEGNSLNAAMKNLGNSIGQYDPDGSFAAHKVDTTKASDRYQYADSDKKSAYDTATDAVSNIISVENGTVNKNKGTYADQATVEKLTEAENKAWNELNGVKPKDNEVNSPSGGTITIEKGHALDSTDAANAITNKDSLTNVKSYSWSGTPDTSKPGSISPKVIVTYNDNSADEVPVTVKIKGDADKYNPEGGEITVNRNTKLGSKDAENAIKNSSELPPDTKYDWEKSPDTSKPGTQIGTVVVTYPDKTTDKVNVSIDVKRDSETYKVTPKDKVSVDKGEDVDPASLVTVTDPDGKQVQLPAGSIDWKDGAKPDLTTSGDKAGIVEVTFTDGSAKDVPVKVHVKTDAETYDPQAQPWTTTVGKTPKADEVISSTDKNGKKMPSDAKYTWKTEPDTSKTGEASGVVKVTYSDESQDEVPVTINVKDKLDDNEKYHIYGKDGLKVDKNGTLAPQDAIDVKDADGNKTTLPENSIVAWTKKPDFSQAGKDVTGEVTVTYPDHTKSDPVTVTVHVNGKSDEYKVAPRDGVTVPRGSQVDPEKTVVAQTPDGKPTSFPKGTKHEWVTKPDTDSTGKRTGVVKTTFPDGSTTTTTVSVTVEPNQSDKITPKVPSTKEPVANTSSLTDGEKAKVQQNVEDANKDKNGKSTLPEGTTVTVGSDGTATVTYPDGSKDTIPGSDLVRPATDADKTTPKVPSTKEPVANTSSLTDGEKAKVQQNVEDANKDKNGKSTLPEGTTVTVGSDGTATVTYPDGSKDTIPGSDLVRPATDADKTTPKVPSTKEPVANTSSLTDGEKAKVQQNVEDANKDKNGKSTLPEGTTVTVGSDGTATVTYPDGSKDTIPGSDLVRPATDADKTTPKVPSTKEPVANTSSLTDGEKAKVQQNVEDANKDKNGKSTLPEGTTVTVGSDGTATVTYPDGSKDTIPGSDLVRPATDADKTTPKVPSTKEPVANTSSLTDGEKAKVQQNVEDANKDKNGKSTLPEGTTVTVGSDGTATVTYPDGSKDTIPGSDLVRPATDADKTTPKVPSTKEPVANTSSLTDGEKAKVQQNVEDANKDKNGKSTLPEGTTVTVGSDGTATVTYPDGSKDTIPGSDLVRPATDADKTTPKVPSTKEPVANTSSLTDGEKAKVQQNVEDANKDKNGKSTLPEGTTVTVGSDGTATVTYPDGSKDTIPGSDLVRPATDADKTTPKVPSTKEPVANTSSLTDGEKAKVQQNVEDANKDKNGKSTLPEGTTVTVGSDGTATVTYPDGSKDTIPGSDLVRPATDADKTTPKVPSTKEPVANTSSLTDGEKAKVQQNVEDANKDKNGKSTLPEGTTVTVGSDGTATVTYPDGSKDTIPGSDLVRPATDADKTTPKVPSTKEPVANTSSLTDGEKAKVQQNVEDANKDKNGKSTLPEGTTVTVGSDGTATVTYPDGSKDTIPGSDLVRPATDADKTTPKVPSTKEPVANTSSLTDGEKAKVQQNVEDANKDKNGKSTLPEGTTVTVGSDGTATVTYPDGSKDTIPGDQLVQGQKGSTTDAGNITPTVPGGKVTVKDPSHLTDDEKKQVKNNVDNANKDKFPAGTTVTVGSDGTATVTYPDGSKDTIPGDQLVQGQKGSTTDAGNITPTVPGGKVTVKDPSHLTDDEKKQVKNNVDNANKDKFPAGTTVTVGSDGTATVTYPDGSKDTIPGDQLVQGQKGSTTDAGNITPTVPGGKVTVKDPSHLTDDEKKQVKNNVDNANKDKFPAGTTVTVGSDGTATVTYPDGSKDTIPGDQLVQGQKGDTTDAGNITPTIPGGKVTVKDPSHLTDDEKNQVKNNVDNANKDKFPEGTTVTVGSDGTATVTYPDGSKDTIPGDQLVQGQKGSTTDAGNITPTVPGGKVTVKDPSHLTDDEKNQVKNNVDNANKDKFPEGTTVTVGSDGTATVTYPDGSKDTIPGDQLVQGQKGSTTDAGNITPTVPGGKVTVKDPSHLTDDEKKQVKNNVDNANKDKFPAGTTVTVGSDGTATVTYPDGSKDTIPGSDLVRPATDADKTTPKVPSTKEPVANTSSLTDGEKAKVQQNVEDANKDKNGKSTLPAGTTVTVGSDGTATVTYPDGSKDTIPGDQLVQGQKGDTTDAGNITPTIPGGKVTVKDPSHLTDDEKNQVKNNVDNANKDKFPAGTTVTVGSDGTATVTYPDGSKDTIPGDQLVQGQKGDTTDAGNITPTVPGGKVTVKDPSHLTDDEKNQVKNNVDNANKDKFPDGTEVTVGDDGTTTVTYPDGSKDTIPGDQLVQGQKGDTTDAGNITPTVPGGKVTVKDPSHLTDDEKNQVKNNVDNANKDKFPAGTEVTVGDDGTTTVTYPDGSKDTIPGDQLVQGQKGDTTDAGNITPTVPGGKVTVKDPSHLTDDEKNQVKNNVDNANKDKFPDGTKVTVGDDGTATVTYPDGSKDVIAGTDLVITAKSEDVLGSKHHSHKNGSNSSQADGVKGASTANGSIANAGNNLGVKGESDNAIGNNKATSLKTLPQTGTKDTSILGVLGMLLASLGLFVFKKKRDEK